LEWIAPGHFDVLILFFMPCKSHADPFTKKSRAAEMADMLLFGGNSTPSVPDRNVSDDQAFLQSWLRSRQTTAPYGNASRRSSSSTSRKLLLFQQQRQDPNDGFVKAYSGWVSNTKGFSNLQVGRSSLTDSWLQGPLMWPPVFNHLADTGLECEAAEEAVSAVLQVSSVMKRYYTSEAYLSTVKVAPWGLSSNLPRVHMSKKLKNSNSSFAQVFVFRATFHRKLPCFSCAWWIHC
jgi:hypothetical protein